VFIVGALSMSGASLSARKAREALSGPASDPNLPAKASQEKQRAAGLTGLASYADDKSSLRFALWLGLLGWALQGLVEFGLYIPALAWPAFTFLGLLLSSADSNRR